jgi:3D (Asp-Asp-Asp) domain-containing protein
MKPRTYVLLIFYICALVFMGYAVGITYKRVQTRLTETTALKWQIEGLENESAKMAGYKTQLNTLTQQISALQAEIDRKQDKSDRSGERGERRIMEVTAYWEGSCGKALDDPEYGITSSGKYVQDGYIAAGPEFKIGQRIYIPYFDKTFTVMDRGKDIVNGHLDIYMRTAKACFEFGRVYGMEVWVMD